jgi:hypothetical protein
VLSILRWVEEGGLREDDGAWYDYLFGRARSYRHFHDPLRPWAEGGLSPTLPFSRRWESAVRWAQQTNQQAETGFGDFSWVNARASFHQALTAETPAAREAAFAQTFRALGQVMHLLTDMSVPEHVRDDRHPIEGPFGYEGWVLAQHRGGAAAAGLAPYLQGGPPVDPALFALPPRPGEPIAVSPIARLFDSDRYEGETPDPAVTAEAVIGLAEVTNANFFSAGSVHFPYPHPVRAALVPYQATYEKTGTRRIYYYKPAPGLVVTPALVECVLDEVANTRGVCPDDAVFRATAQHLLPRAVTYSAALLDYFFRGRLEVQRDGRRLRVVNRSPEALGEGGILTVYRDTAEGVRAEMGAVSLALTTSVPKDNTDAPIYLTLPDPPPDGRLTVVYRGRVGAEPDAVIGQVVPELIAEGLAYDWERGEWVLQNPSGLFVLPLRRVANLSAGIGRIVWGARDNHLVATTVPDRAAPDAYEIILFEVARPLGASTVPVEPGPTGQPEVVLTVRARVPIYQALAAAPLETAVEMSAAVQAVQYAAVYQQNTECVQELPYGYVCDTTYADGAPLQLGTWAGTASKRFPILFTPEHHGQLSWNDPPADYDWALVEFGADATGRLVGTIGVNFRHLRGDDVSQFTAWRLKEVRYGGGLQDSEYAAVTDGDAFSMPGWILATVDFSAPRVIAKSSADELVVRKTVHSVSPSPLYAKLVMRTAYSGGTADGQVVLEEAGSWLGDGGSPPPFLIGSSLSDKGQITFDTYEGMLRPSLSPLELPGIDRSQRDVIALQDLPYRVTPDGIPVVMRTVRPVRDDASTLAYPLWSRWSGTGAGVLDAVLTAYDPQGNPEGDWRHWVFRWDLAADAVKSLQVIRTSDPSPAVLGNSAGILLANWFKEWIWIPWEGSPTTLQGTSSIFPSSFVLLDPTYLLNTATGRFHRIAPGLPEAEGPRPLPQIPSGSEYHLMFSLTEDESGPPGGGGSGGSGGGGPGPICTENCILGATP